MAVRIRNDYAGEVPVYLTVMHGGLPFAGALALELGALGLDLEFDYLHATRYRGATSGGELLWKHRPATPLRGRRVLLVDDIVDEGHTLAAVGHGAAAKAPAKCGSPRWRSRPTTAACRDCARTTPGCRCRTVTCSAMAWISTSRAGTCRRSTP